MTIETFAGLSTLAFVMASAVVGVRLLVLSRRTRGIPEATFGMGLLVVAAIGYPLMLAGPLVAPEAPELGRWLIAISALPMGVGRAAVWIFTLKVFRAHSRIARRVVFVALITLAGLSLACLRLPFTVLDPSEIRYTHPLIVAHGLHAVVSYLWAAVESFRYGAKMRRRIAIGLADPVVTNRFYLFGWSMLMATSATGIASISAAFGIQILESPAVLFSSSLAGLLCGGTLWFAFVPPAAYLRLLRQAPA